MNQQVLLPQVSSGDMLGRYRIMRRLGRGGMGEVWLCEDQRLNRQVAVKTLPTQNQQDRTFIQRFEREAKAAAALNHPHVLPVHDYGKQPLADDRIITYIVMPYIQGGSLSERIAFYNHQSRLMPYEEALTFLSQAANAIDYAHKRRLIHRDIKPDNMLLRDENWLLLADFGIARMLTGMAFSPDRTRLAIANTQISDTTTQITLCTPDLKNISQIPFSVSAEEFSSDIDGIAWIDDQHIAFAHSKSVQGARDTTFYQLYLIDAQQSPRQLTIFDETKPYDPHTQAYASVLSSFRTGPLAVIHKRNIVIGQINTPRQPTWHKRATIDLSQYAPDQYLGSINMVERKGYIMCAGIHWGATWSPAELMPMY